MPESGAKLPHNRIHLFDPVGLISDKAYDSFSMEIKGGRLASYDHSNPGSGEIPMYTAVTFVNQTNENDLSVKEINGWRPSSPLNPASPKSPGSPIHSNHHQTMSPNSRTQAIARGRKELMDMVRDLPETFYELSLRDIVEKQVVEVHKEIDSPLENKPVKEMIRAAEEKKSNIKVKNKNKNKKKKMARSTSADNEKFLLKTSVFPLFLGSKKTKKSTSGSFKIAPVPKPQTTPTRSMKSSERDWWRRKSCISSESEESNGLSSNSSSSGSSRSSSRSNSNSSDGRRSSRFLPTCCFFNRKSLKRMRDKK